MEKVEESDFYFYLGSWTDNKFNEILRGRTEMSPSFLGTIGLRYRLGDVFSSLSKEVEFNYTQHFGKQYHPELNAAFNLRWEKWPWNRYLKTSVAYGIGPSLAFARPKIEDKDSPSNLLLFMVGEVAIELPGRWKERNIEFLARVHHRSGVFGIVSDASGSNFISLGLRFPLTNIYSRKQEGFDKGKGSPQRIN